MSEVTSILSRLEEGDPSASDELLSLVYDELRKLASSKLKQEKPGQTLQATALVHEAYLRLVNVPTGTVWNSRGHFFAAAAEAMRRILVENARSKQRQKRGGDVARLDIALVDVLTSVRPENLLAIDDAITALANDDHSAAELVKLRYYAGLSVAEAADVLKLSRSTAYEHWAYARAWLRREMGGDYSTPAT